MALTVNNLNTVSLLNILNRTSTAQDKVLERLSTGYKVNNGADDPAGLIAISSLDAEITSVDAAVSSNQRTNAMLGVAEGALAEIGDLVGEIQRLANEAANDAGLSADEIAANQSQIDDALASIDRIVGNTTFNGKKLIDGSLGIHAGYTTAAISDVKVYSRKSGDTDATLTVKLTSAASAAAVSGIAAAGGASADVTFTVQGKLGTAVIEASSTEDASDIAAKINETAAQTGLSADTGGASGSLRIFSKAKGEDAFVNVKLLEGSGISNDSDVGEDADVTVNGQTTAVDGDHVNYSGNGVSLSFELNGLAAGASTTITISGSGGSYGSSGATFQLGVDSNTRATVGLNGMYTQQLGTVTEGYLASLKSGGTNSLLNDPQQAAEIARQAVNQVATERGRIGGFQKFQVQTSVNSLTNTKESLESAVSVIRDVDYAAESAELSRQNVLLQSAISLLGLTTQQSANVLSLLG